MQNKFVTEYLGKKKITFSSSQIPQHLIYLCKNEAGALYQWGWIWLPKSKTALPGSVPKYRADSEVEK